MTRWTSARANAWGAARPWVCGFNFLPSSAVNFLEMWHTDTFDRATIERELGWAAEIGFNALRVNLHFLIWQNDRDGLLARLDRFLDIAARLGLDTVPCFFDDCGFGGAEPVYGPQPDPLPGVHNSRAVASPGRLAVMNPSLWPQFEQYVRDLTRQFRADPRILFWDLYNEPGNRMIFAPEGARAHQPDITAQSLALMTDAFAWARAEDPVHPLTVGAWTTPPPGSDDPPYQTTVDQTALALSDIITFHAYGRHPQVVGIIDHLAAQGRPMLCTEWMARPVGSLIGDQLTLFRDRNVGCFQWGMVKGRTQTWLSWPEELVRAHGGTDNGDQWFHDLLEGDGTPFDTTETETVHALTRKPDRDRTPGRS